jgi:hypothetical protein
MARYIKVRPDKPVSFANRYFSGLRHQGEARVRLAIDLESSGSKSNRVPWQRQDGPQAQTSVHDNSLAIDASEGIRNDITPTQSAPRSLAMDDDHLVLEPQRQEPVILDQVPRR